MIANHKVLSTFVLFIIIKTDTSAIQSGAHFYVIISSFIKKNIYTNGSERAHFYFEDRMTQMRYIRHSG